MIVTHMSLNDVIHIDQCLIPQLVIYVCRTVIVTPLTLFRYKWARPIMWQYSFSHVGFNQIDTQCRRELPVSFFTGKKLL